MAYRAEIFDGVVQWSIDGFRFDLTAAEFVAIVQSIRSGSGLAATLQQDRPTLYAQIVGIVGPVDRFEAELERSLLDLADEILAG